LARAKPTNRAEARRRYRQTVAQATVEAGDDATGDATPASSAQRSVRPTSGADRAQPRAGVFSAFRGAYRPARIRDDLRLLPELVRGRWFLISVGLVVIGPIVFAIYPTSITLFIFQSLSLPPAIIPIFLVGFTSTRASYLLGAMVGAVNAIVLAAFVQVFSGFAADLGLPSARSAIVIGAAYGIPGGILFASLAAWYKRFLALSNPRRQQAPSRGRKTTSKAPARR